MTSETNAIILISVMSGIGVILFIAFFILKVSINQIAGCLPYFLNLNSYKKIQKMNNLITIYIFIR